MNTHIVNYVWAACRILGVDDDDARPLIFETILRLGKQTCQGYLKEVSSTTITEDHHHRGNRQIPKDRMTAFLRLLRRDHPLLVMEVSDKLWDGLAFSPITQQSPILMIILSSCRTDPTYDRILNVKDRYQSGVAVCNTLVSVLVEQNSHQRKQVMEMSEILEQLNSFIHDIDHTP